MFIVNRNVHFNEINEVIGRTLMSTFLFGKHKYILLRL